MSYFLPYSSQLWGNLLWAALITCLVCVPALAVLGTRAHQWVRVLIHSRYVQCN